MFVLIVDDIEMARRNIRIVLEREGVSSIEAATGSQALDVLKSRNDIDIVTLDIDLPDINGMEVLKRIREFNKEIKVILISGMINNDVKAHGERYSVYLFLHKPLDLIKLTQIVKNIRERN